MYIVTWMNKSMVQVGLLHGRAALERRGSGTGWVDAL